MDKHQIVSALQHLEAVAKAHQKKIRVDAVYELPRGVARPWSEEYATAHVRWMCTQAADFVRQDRLDKAQRWLCFGQGVLWTLGIADIDTFREANMRPDSTFRS